LTSFHIKNSAADALVKFHLLSILFAASRSQVGAPPSSLVLAHALRRVQRISVAMHKKNIASDQSTLIQPDLKP